MLPRPLTAALLCTGVQWARHAMLEEGICVQAASAVRLLYSALQHLDQDAPAVNYPDFYSGLDARVRSRLTIPDVLNVLRMALEVPDGEYLLLVPLIDQAYLATGRFGVEKQAEVTQLTSSISGH